MTRTRPFTIGALLLLSGSAAQAQTRYLEEVFTDAQVTLTPDVYYGTNVDFLTSDFSTVPPTINTINLTMDVYQPDQGVDAQTGRPVVLYIHTGNLLPPPLNSSPNGTKRDSCAIVACRQLARMGYVAVAIDYRLGWNPIAPTQEERLSGLLNATYRAMADLKQCIRTMKEDAAGANTWHINADKNIVWGEGTGGYIALASATLDDPLELYIEKFRPDIFDPTVSYVDSTIDGNIHGIGGSLNLYTDNGFSHDFAMCVNMGGALADTSWLADGDMPMVSFHTVRDDFAPFESGVVYVPVSPPLEVVNVQGPNLFIPLANSYGNNDAFATLPGGDPYTDRARALYGTTWSSSGVMGTTTLTVASAPAAEGLFPIIRDLRPPFTNEASPWQWWDPASPLAAVVIDPGPPPVTTHMAGLSSNPDMSVAKGRAYLDTCIQYAAPRIVCALELGPCSLVGIPETSATAQGVEIVPNPSNGPVTITSKEAVILAYDLFDVNSRLVRSLRVNASQFTLDRGDLENGAYLIQLHFEEGGLTRKLILD